MTHINLDSETNREPIPQVTQLPLLNKKKAVITLIKSNVLTLNEKMFF